MASVSPRMSYGIKQISEKVLKIYEKTLWKTRGLGIDCFVQEEVFGSTYVVGRELSTGLLSVEGERG